mmetsp:Transcript_9516/g.27337  ORF Transcript_9516/g.27337 Transcript_9516/m.27337 type:complete len:216 (-) Transcript_9516:2-649(-)
MARIASRPPPRLGLGALKPSTPRCIGTDARLPTTRSPVRTRGIHPMRSQKSRRGSAGTKACHRWTHTQLDISCIALCSRAEHRSWADTPRTSRRRGRSQPPCPPSRPTCRSSSTLAGTSILQILPPSMQMARREGTVSGTSTYSLGRRNIRSTFCFFRILAGTCPHSLLPAQTSRSSARSLPCTLPAPPSKTLDSANSSSAALEFGCGSCCGWCV